MVLGGILVIGAFTQAFSMGPAFPSEYVLGKWVGFVLMMALGSILFYSGYQRRKAES
jgi:hypothetical protein